MKEYTVKVYDSGTKKWYLNDQLHREDGPAVEFANGTKYWYLNDQFHREDGPAVERVDGSKEWWVNGKYLGDKDPNVAKEMTVAEISKALGYDVKVVK